jgi:hypothetical protein
MPGRACLLLPGIPWHIIQCLQLNLRVSSIFIEAIPPCFFKFIGRRVLHPNFICACYFKKEVFQSPIRLKMISVAIWQVGRHPWQITAP